MKKILLPFLFFAFMGIAGAQTLLLEENFNYPTGSLLTANGWAAHSGGGSAPIAVAAGLSYSGYISSGIGGAAYLTNTGEDDNKAFTAQTSGVFYSAFLVKVDVATAGYFINLLNTATTFAGRVFVQPGTAQATQFQFGVSNTSTGVYRTTDFTLGQTYLCVLKYDFSTGTDLGTSSLWVFSSGVPATESAAGAPLITSTGTGQSSLSGFALRQYSATQRQTVDGIRISGNWGLAVTGTATSVEDKNSNIPSQFELSQNYPNPFNPSTIIKYQMPQSSHVNIRVYDVLGNKISTLVNQEKAAGSYEVKFDASNVPSGVYFYTIQTGSFTQTKKMILMK